MDARSDSAEEVVIVGAGPTGLTAALRLTQLGVPHVVLDAAATPTQTSNAALVHASTLELLAELGAADQLIEAGGKVVRIVMVDRGRVLARIGLTGVPSRHPFALSVPQSTTEQVLLRRLGASVRRDHRVTAVREDGDGYLVTGTAGSPAGPVPFEVRARYVIGADGSNSVVRSAAGLDFPGETYPSQFVLADAELAGRPFADDEATINLSAQGVTVIGRLPGGTHRIIATVVPGFDVPRAPGRAYMDSLLSERGIDARLAADPVWSSRFRVHHRVADRFRVGGVFLAGDAAHVHSPAAGQGMNTGIADAYDLSTRLAAVLNGLAAEPVLDGYETERRAAALEVLRFTDRMTKLATLNGPVARTARRVAVGTGSRIGPLRHQVTMWITGLKRSPLRSDLPLVTPRRAEPTREESR
ncbi:FAD-dependent monooxygenase [Actinoallomurus iriomotensis]|uniref:Pentachlorophenol monooxygenase n=1 Tax=Actinoallomurus iriomotensis TaxID=478107 RepID=A0A9W6RHW2_9ACTN|nr:FAD-dependent monooxygenase [Actinoallomurus iriomotensis]GLY74342.1 pentachlorophenol monooxygenase [Actinoallomurus iriomotensis]